MLVASLEIDDVIGRISKCFYMHVIDLRITIDEKLRKFKKRRKWAEWKTFA